MMVSVGDGDFVGDRVEKEPAWLAQTPCLALLHSRPVSRAQSKPATRPETRAPVGWAGCKCLGESGHCGAQRLGKIRGRVTRETSRQRKRCRACASNDILMR